MTMQEELQARRANDKFILEACLIKHDDIERRLANLETMLTKISSRPPVWATTVISILCMLVGVLLGKVV